MKHDNLKYFCLRLSPFVVGAEGNVSVRTTSGFIIKSSGMSFRNPSFTSCDIDGIQLSNEEKKPSMEAGFHSFIYKNSGYRVIAHTHPTNILKILCTDKIYDFATKRLFPDQVVFNGSSACIVPYVIPGKDLTLEIERLSKLYDSCPSVFLLKNHGIICCGYSTEQVITMTEIAEKSAEIFLGANNPNFLSPEQITEIQNHPDELYRKDTQ